MYLYTSESVSAGHPDKCADIIADSIVDALLALDSSARVATEVFLVGTHIVIGGEVKTTHDVDEEFYKTIARRALWSIGYPEAGFAKDETLDPGAADIEVYISRQSPDISRGVELGGKEIGAGDQGMMVGFASAENDEYMPSALLFARLIRDALYAFALENPSRFGVDIKTQVTVDYGTKENFDNGRPLRIAKIVVAIPHNKKIEIAEVRKIIKETIVQRVKFPKGMFEPENVEFFINHTGRFVSHGPIADSGLSGRKVMSDTYGAYAPVGGGSQSSKDYTKVDRSGLYAARWLAKHIVAAGLAKKAQVQIAYVIGKAEPISLTVDTLHTSLIGPGDEKLSEQIAKRFPLTPRWITQKFGLDRPAPDRFLYADVAARGQIGYLAYPWERLDELEWFKSLAKC